MDCPKCRNFLVGGEIDSRQDLTKLMPWVRYEYWCKFCKETFSRKVTFNIQSEMVESDEWEKG